MGTQGWQNRHIENDWTDPVGWRNTFVYRLTGGTYKGSSAGYHHPNSVPLGMGRAISGPWTQLSWVYTKSRILSLSKTATCSLSLFKRGNEPETLLSFGVTQSAWWRPAAASGWAEAKLDHHGLDLPEDVKTAPLTSIGKRKREEGGKGEGRETERGNCALITSWHLE